MENELWLGSLSLYQAMVSRQEAFQAALLTGTLSAGDENPPENFTLFGNIAVIDITGALTNDDSWRTWWSGDTSYNQIRRAAIEAATHSDVKCIVLNIDSGGGTPNGLADVGDMVRQISASGIKCYAYSGGVMASAAYWLGASCEKIYCGETADIGSIGVISIHKDITGALKQAGITATVSRAGAEKALNNPYEKLTDKAKEGIQTRINALYDVFINRIADYRGVPPDYVREHMADGKEFIGQQALEAGLVDGISTLDDLITGLQAKLDKQTAGKETSMATKKGTTVLTQAQRDAMMEGAPVDTVLEIEPTTAASPEETNSTETSASSTPAAPETPEEVKTETAANETGLVSYLRSELSEKSKEVLALTTELAAVKAENLALSTVHEPMKKLVAASISRMQVALGAPAMDMSDLPAETLLSQHAKITETFCTKFPVGGVAAVQVDDKPAKAVVPHQMATRLRQNKI